MTYDALFQEDNIKMMKVVLELSDLSWEDLVCKIFEVLTVLDLSTLQTVFFLFQIEKRHYSTEKRKK